MEYHVLADGVVWEDEGLRDCHSDLGNLFRCVIYHRTNLITGGNDDRYKPYYDLAKKYFPDWIGFNQDRCSFNEELAERIARIRKVSNRKIDKLFNDDSLDD